MTTAARASQPEPAPSRWVSVQEIARETALSAVTIRRLLKSGEIRGFSIAAVGNERAIWRVRRDVLERWLARAEKR